MNRSAAAPLALLVTLAAANAAPGPGPLERFDRLDRNKDGKLTATELAMPTLFPRLDANRDGVVTKPEVAGFFRLPAAAPQAESPRQGPQPLSPAEAGVGRRVEDVAFRDLSGREHRLAEFQRHRALVVAVTSTTCPVSQRYAPTLAALEQAFAGKDVAFLFLNPIASDTAKDMAATVRQHGFRGPYVHDPGSVLARALGARSTGDAFVLDGARTLVYRGAVDDQYGLAYSLEAPRQRLLSDAIEAVLAGGLPSVAATAAPGCALDLAAAPAAPVPKVTYHNRISRLMQSHCLECHRQGGSAPFSLETPADLAGHAGMIRQQVSRGAMPPWFAAPPAPGDHSPWANDRSLPARDKADLLAWLEAGRPEGDPADAPLPRRFPEGWAIGRPDLVVSIPKPIQVKATGTMPYQNVVVETRLTEDRWVQGLEIQPTAREVVHHVLVFVRKTSAKDGGRPGRAGDEERGGFFAAYVPGNSSVVYPEGFAKFLPAGSSLKFQIHYTPNGTATRDQVRLGLRFAPAPPRHVVRVIGLVNPLLQIPPGANDHVEEAGIPILKPARVLGFLPHMHVRGKAFRYESILADGTVRTLLEVPRYDFNWQLAYRYAEPLSLPVGSRLRARGWFDNSSRNPANPDPTRTVRWGPQTTDEMMLGYVEYYFPEEKPAAVAAGKAAIP